MGSNARAGSSPAIGTEVKVVKLYGIILSPLTVEKALGDSDVLIISQNARKTRNFYFYIVSRYALKKFNDEVSVGRTRLILPTYGPIAQLDRATHF